MGYSLKNSDFLGRGPKKKGQLVLRCRVGRRRIWKKTRTTPFHAHPSLLNPCFVSER